MKKISLFICLLMAGAVFSQTSDTTGEAARRTRQRDSVIDYYQRQRDSLDNAIRLANTALIRQEVRNSADYWVRLQNENRAKQKKAAITRIAIGVAGFAILIIGLMRRRKKR